MNCKETAALMISYLNQETSPSERKMVSAHLSECASCRRELTALSTIQDRVRGSLRRQAAQAVPAPDAWARLQTTLADRARPTHQAQIARWLRPITRSIRIAFPASTLVNKFALTGLVTLALIFGVVAFVPSVRAQVRDMIHTWFHFQLPGGRSSVGVGWGEEEMAFPPYMPVWLPEGLDLALTGFTTAPGAEYVEFEFHPMSRRKQDDRFIRLIEGVGEAIPGLPKGREVTVNGQRAVITSELNSRHEIQSDPPTPAGARLLAWYIGEIKIELVSNLSESEMIAVAESLVPMEEGSGSNRLGDVVP